MRLSAQQFATLSVNVTDPSGGAIPQASVTVKNVETGAKRSDVANATGLVVIPGLAAGDYGLTVHAAQFSEYRAKLTLPVGPRSKSKSAKRRKASTHTNRKSARSSSAGILRTCPSPAATLSISCF